MMIAHKTIILAFKLNSKPMLAHKIIWYKISNNLMYFLCKYWTFISWVEYNEFIWSSSFENKLLFLLNRLSLHLNFHMQI